MEDVAHINLTDPNGQVYCHLVGDVVPFDGPFVAKTCWGCPYWTGLAGGYGVECTYDDPNATANPMKVTKVGAAQSEAPEQPDDPNSVSSQAGIAAMTARQGLQQTGENEEGSPEEESAEPPEEAQQEQQQGQGQQQAPAKQAAPKGGAPVPSKKPVVGAQDSVTPTQQAPAQPGALQVPPKSKKGKVPPQFQKKATTTDVIVEIVKATQFK